MKLFELQEQNLLTDSELDALYEGVAASNPELQKLIVTQLAKPLNKTKQDIISNFVPKLKAWAMGAMNKETDTEFVSKVLNNSEIVAKQLIDNISCRSRIKKNETVVAPKQKQQSKQFYRFKRTSK